MRRLPLSLFSAFAMVGNRRKREDMSTDLKCDLLRKHVNMLSEHFDSVQIVCTALLPDNQTERYVNGSGNWYARVGSVKGWLDRETADTLAQSISREIKGGQEDA